jgi:hypothetical protein
MADAFPISIHHAADVGELWRLTKGTHLAVCSLWTYPLGSEARLDVDGEMLRTQAGRYAMALVDVAREWKAQFQEKGWL